MSEGSPRVFVSWYDGGTVTEAARFFAALEAAGLACDHSPYSPHSGHDDPRWCDWYARGLPEAIGVAQAFVAVVTRIYDSTWMAIEYEVAWKAHRSSGRPFLFIFNPDARRLPLGFKNYAEASATLLTEPLAAAAAVAAALRA